jgi:hypothetical protein
MYNQETKTYYIPKEVKLITEKELNIKPSTLETEFFSIDGLNDILSKNDLIWSNRILKNGFSIYKNGIIKFKGSNVLVYFTKRNEENCYKLFFICEEKSMNSIMFYINKLEKYKILL